jgi:tRNA G10  N-methylase Trm11
MKSNKRITKYDIMIGFGFLVFLVWFLLKMGNMEETRKQEPLVYNSSWDSSVRQVKDYLQNNLKDPKSFEAIEWSKVAKTDSGFMVRCKYRAKNSFGGYGIENKIFLLDRSGRVLSVFDYQP